MAYQPNMFHISIHQWSDFNIMDYMAQEKKATRMEIIEHLREQKYKYSDSAVGKHIRLLCELGYLKKVGRGVYVVVE